MREGIDQICVRRNTLKWQIDGLGNVAAYELSLVSSVNDHGLAAGNQSPDLFGVDGNWPVLRLLQFGRWIVSTGNDNARQFLSKYRIIRSGNRRTLS